MRVGVGKGWARSIGLGIALLVGGTPPILASQVAACASTTSSTPHAGLVIATGTRTTSYCVALDAPKVNGIDLIELAADQYGLDFRLGFGGKAVCMLADVGAEGEDCFGAYPDYWGYFHADGSADWTWASSGAADHSIGDGDMDGWSWGDGDSATTHIPPPAMTIQDVCAADVPTLAGGVSSGASGGPPVGSIFALGLTALLVAGGWFTLRRRRRG
jgi:hypothetical protein